MLKVAAISGSLRRASYTTALLRAAIAHSPREMDVVLFDALDKIPLYNEDDRATGDPEPVRQLTAAFAEADAFIVATPEYNRSFTGVVKNTLDWLSRATPSPVAGKAALVLSCSTGTMGGGFANYHLRQTLSVMGVHVIPGREIAVSSIAERFDTALTLTDSSVRDALQSGLHALATFAACLQYRA